MKPGPFRHGEEAGFQSGKHFIDAAGFDVGLHIFIRPLKGKRHRGSFAFFQEPRRCPLVELWESLDAVSV
jgi:hypothetical protein